MKKHGGRITQEVIDPAQAIAEVEGPTSGAIVSFIGTVRVNGEAGEVDLIDYDAYVPMAERRMLEIEEELRRLWPLDKVKLVHRIGKLGVGEISVVIAVSSQHRAEAFEACRHAIERIKRDVPIWKKERLSTGREVWVEGQAKGSRSRTRTK
jgi:molybdopterin synthase catalytic subunit